MIELAEMFPNEKAAEDFFVEVRWPDGVRCPCCGAEDIQERKTRKPQPYRCRTCRKDFSVKTDSLTHNSPLGCRTWLFAIYLLTTNIKGVSSTRLRRELGITQKSAWHLAHRIRENFQDYEWMEGPVEIDEAYFGGKERNKHESEKMKSGRGAVGKAIVQLLWRSEALDLLASIGKDNGVKSKPRQALWGRLVETLKPEDLYMEVRSALKARTNWRKSDRRRLRCGVKLPDGARFLASLDFAPPQHSRICTDHLG